MKTLCVIPARAGSKGVLGKNLKEFCGVPLVGHMVQIARSVFDGGDVVVSTDSDEIAAVADRYLATVVRRPAHYAADDSPSELALLHVLDVYWRKYERVLMLQPTSPLVTPTDIAAALQLSAISVVSVNERHGFGWRQSGTSAEPVGWVPGDRPMRQQRREHDENGAIYVTRVDALRATMRRTSGHTELYPMPTWQSLQLDSLDDWTALECLHRQQCGEC
jgi:CMP-N,N'-diacetyllegionaminic acid synthase